MVDFLGRYLRNLAIVAMLLAAAWVLLKLFFPAAMERFDTLGQLIGVGHIWPVLLVVLLLLALPWRKE